MALAGIVKSNDPRRPEIVIGNPNGRVPAGAVHVASVRSGHEPGTHTVAFDGEFDTIELTHSSRGRAGLALGAVIAAEWVEGKTGMFGFDKVLSDLQKKGG
jgi:4-hydroxy-tetrahydrodipicolinate reductase